MQQYLLIASIFTCVMKAFASKSSNADFQLQDYNVGGVKYSEGFYTQTTYSNAPHSCDGKAVYSQSVKYSLQSCSVDVTAGRSYRQLLDVANCKKMLISGFKNLQCKGIAYFNQTMDLYLVGCSFGISSSCSSQVEITLDDYPIVKASMYDSDSDCNGNVTAYMAASTDKCYYQNSSEPGAPSVYEKVEATSSEISIKSYSTLSTCQSSSSPLDVQKYVPNTCNTGNGRTSAAIFTYIATKSGSTTTTTTTTTTSTSSSSDKGFFDTTWHIIVIVVAIVVFCLLIGGVLYYFLVIKASPSTHPTSSSVLPTTGKETGAPTNSVTYNSPDVVV